MWISVCTASASHDSSQSNLCKMRKLDNLLSQWVNAMCCWEKGYETRVTSLIQSSERDHGWWQIWGPRIVQFLEMNKCEAEKTRNGGEGVLQLAVLEVEQCCFELRDLVDDNFAKYLRWRKQRRLHQVVSLVRRQRRRSIRVLHREHENLVQPRAHWDTTRRRQSCGRC